MRNESFDGLRGWWIILIFICHWSIRYGFDKWSGIFFTRGGGYGVAGFFVLSGYLNNKKHYNDSFSLFDAIKFSLYRIKKLYVLHLICMLPYLTRDLPIIYEYFINGNKAWQNYVIKYGMNVMLLQSIFIKWGSVNGVSWFLSCIMIVYLLTPWLLRVNKIINKKKLNLCCVVIFLIVLYLLNRYEWTYHSPFFRVFQYMVGIIFANISEMHYKYERQIKNIALGIAVILSLGAFVLPPGNWSIVTDTLAVSGCIYAAEDGENKYLKKITTIKPILAVGKASSVIFLIHYPIISFGANIIEKYFNGHFAVAVLHGFILFAGTWLLWCIWNTLMQKRVKSNL